MCGPLSQSEVRCRPFAGKCRNSFEFRNFKCVFCLLFCFLIIGHTSRIRKHFNFTEKTHATIPVLEVCSSDTVQRLAWRSFSAVLFTAVRGRSGGRWGAVGGSERLAEMMDKQPFVQQRSR